MKKKEITSNEYQQAIKTLNFIENEKNLLKELYQTKKYQCHLYLTENLDELLLTIKKENETIDRQINLKKKELFSSLKIIPKITNSKNIVQINLIEKYLSTLPNQNNDISYLLTLLPNYSKFHQEIKKLISIKEANLSLENYILTLKSQELIALKIKIIYEKQRKKSLSKSKIFSKKN